MGGAGYQPVVHQDQLRCSRPDGYAPIESYAVLGDGRTVGLLAPDGRLDWLPLPTLDAPPAFAALLDPEHGGHLCVAPVGGRPVRRRYLDGTNVVVTTYAVDGATVDVTASLNRGVDGPLPWAEVAFRIEASGGPATVAWELVPGDRFRSASPWVRHRGDLPLASVGDQTVGVVLGDLPAPELARGAIRGRVEVAPGGARHLAMVATDHEPLFVPPVEAVASRMEATVDWWRRWSAQVRRDDGCWGDAVHRSALALRVLLSARSGAIAAAGTTSLPESMGGSKNWDYRYSWVRDSSFTIDALIALDLHEETHQAVSWLLDAVRRNGPEIHVFYTLGGEAAEAEADPPLPGYRGSRPVRSGNSAAGQTQLGVYGDLFDTVHRYCAEDHVLDTQTARLLADQADRCCDEWQRRDSGIWELAQLEHYTISKMGCWVALDRAVRLAESGQVPDDHLERWRAEAEAVHRWVDEHCWSDARRSYTFHAGTDQLDAATLLAGRTGFDRGERLAGTVEAVIGELSRGPLVYRYSGMDAEEGAFVACTFWLVEALVHTGQVERAVELMDEAVARANDVGLLAEQVDPGSGAFLGNVPQGLSHLALVNAAATIGRATGWRTRAADEELPATAR